MQRPITILLLMMLVLLPGFTKKLYAQVYIILTDTTNTEWIGRSIFYLIDRTDKITFEQIRTQELDSKFERCEQEVPNFGNKRLTIWNKFTLVNKSSKTWILSELNDNDTLTFYYKDTSGNYETIISGASKPLSSKKYKTNLYAFDLPVRYGDTAIFYLKVETRNCEYPLIVSSYEAFVQAMTKRNLLKGLYYGFVLLIIIYNIALYVAVRDKSYLYYILYVLFTALLMTVLSGIYPLLLGDTLHFLWNAGPTITALGIICFMLFSQAFLQLRKKALWFNRGINYIFIPTLCFIVILNLMNRALLASVLNQVIGLVALVSFFLVALYVYMKGYKAARFYILACSFYFVGVCVYVLKTFAVLPYNYFTTNAMELGSALEMMMFSVSMGDRINIYRKEKSKAQRELISSLQEKTSMQHEMLELEAKALRSQMNPHFIFNCMNSIKALIQQKEEDKAVSYLTTFAKLLRTILQNSDKREITLHDEIETCRLYTQLESMRFGNKFSYTFSIDPSIDLKSIQVPALILQPFIENSIWHGIMPKEEEGHVKVSVEKSDDTIRCIIDDNGIGRERALKNRFKHQASTHQSKGVNLTQSRLDLDNALNNRNASVKTIDKKDELGNALGTTVTLTFKEY